jgi:hypothetical protein
MCLLVAVREVPHLELLDELADEVLERFGSPGRG